MRFGLGSPRQPDMNPKESPEAYFSRAETYANSRGEDAEHGSGREKHETFNKRLDAVLKTLKDAGKPVGLGEIWNAVSGSELFKDKNILQSFLNTASFQNRILKLPDPQRPDTRNRSHYLFSAVPESGAAKSNS